MKPTVLITDRLHSGDWRDLTSSELAALFAPEVVEFLPSSFHARTTETDQRAFLTAMSQQAEVFALYNVQNAGIGLLVLSGAPADHTERHLGYLFAQDYWGQGLATEMITGLQASFRNTGTSLSGGVMKGNTASARLLQRAGFDKVLSGEEVIYRWSSSDEKIGPQN